MTGPGWYPDPEHESRDRYWDGAAWTDESRPHVEGPSPESPATPRPAPPPVPAAAGDDWRRVLLVGGFVVLIVAAGVAGFAYARRDSGSATSAAPVVPPPGSRTTTTHGTAPSTGPATGSLVPSSVVASSTRETTSDACTPPNPTSFSASNLTDGRPDSAWMPNANDNSPTVTLSFDGAVRLAALQLVDGYPKQDPCRTDINRFYQFMRPTLLSVDLHDGSAPQRLTVVDTPDVQTLRVAGTTDRLTLTILQSASPDPTRILSGAQIPFSIPAISELTVAGAATNR